MANIHKNRLNKSKIIDQFIQKHGNLYDYSQIDYQGDNVKVTILCPTHGAFLQIPSSHKRGHKCQKCQGRNLSLDEIIQQFNSIHQNLYSYALITSIEKNSQKIPVLCPIHGIFNPTVNNHKRGNGCKKCAGLEKPTNDQLINKFRVAHGSKYNYSDVIYKSAHTKIQINCPIHGAFQQTPNNHKNGNGCPACNDSTGESRIRTFLEQNNIIHISQHKFEGCKNKLRLPFDFYLPDSNVCIEYNGLQHYKAVEYFGGAKELIKRQANDKIKEEYCKIHNISLIIIRYNDSIELKLSKLIQG